MAPAPRQNLTNALGTGFGALALAVVLGVSAEAIQPNPTLQGAAAPASAGSALAGSKEANPLEELARVLGIPAGVLAIFGSGWFLFTRGKPIQENKKAWVELLQPNSDNLEPPPSPQPPSLPPAAALQASAQVNGESNTALTGVNAGGDISVGNTTINNYLPAAESHRQRVLSTIDPPPQGVGVMGREQELQDLAERMGEPGNNRRLVVFGESGVGKSELLREYARSQEARYPGGRYWIDCRLNPAQEIANLGRQCWQMTWLEGPLQEQAVEVLQLLAREKVLLVFDNATSEEQVEPFLPPAGQAHVLLSSTSREWGPPLVEVWRPEGLKRLDLPRALAMFERVAGAAVAQLVGEKVIAELGGLPVHLLPTARTLSRQARLGRLGSVELLQLSEEGIDSFSLAWGALDPAAKLLLQAAGRWFNSNSLMEGELVAALAQSFQGEAVVRNAVDACRDLFLLQGEERLTMHQLLVRFSESQPPQQLEGLSLIDLGPAVAAALGKAAQRLEEAPADGEALAHLQCHQLSWDFWSKEAEGPAAPECHHLGEALFVMGQFAEASRWFEQAATQIRRASELDHLALGDNLHELGYCVGFPQNHGQVNRSHAMTLRLFIHDQSNQDKAPVHGAAEAGSD